MTFTFLHHGEVSLLPLLIQKKIKLFVFGSEAHGFSDAGKDAPYTFHLPMADGVESLNLGVCASIIMEKTYSECN